MEDIIGKYVAVKLPDELHVIVLTRHRFISAFVRKLRSKISLKKFALAFLGGIAFATHIPNVLAGMEVKIDEKWVKDVEMKEGSLIFSWQEIEKVYFNDWQNIIRIKVRGKKYSYVLNPEDYEEIKKKICGKS